LERNGGRRQIWTKAVTGMDGNKQGGHINLKEKRSNGKD